AEVPGGGLAPRACQPAARREGPAWAVTASCTSATRGHPGHTGSARGGGGGPLLELGGPGGIMDAADPPPPADPLSPNPNNPDNPSMSAGFTFLGQFVDHDITFDPTSSLERQADPESIRNFRTPALELDSLYGSGRGASPHLYDQAAPGAIKLLLDAAAPRDLPRNSQNVALIGDPRNDENLIVSQLHLAFVKFHNAVVDDLLAGGIGDPNGVFDEAHGRAPWPHTGALGHQ